MPIFSMVRIISERRSWKWSMGGIGEIAFLVPGLVAEVRAPRPLPEFQMPSTESMW